MNKIYCKWVSENMTTRNNTHWEIGVPNECSGQNYIQLCQEGVFHYNHHPLLAVMFKYSHGCDNYTKLYEIKPQGVIVEGWDKSGSTILTLIKELEIPKINRFHKAAFAILCSLSFCKDQIYIDWANNWLNGKDRSRKSTKKILDYINCRSFWAELEIEIGVFACYSAMYCNNLFMPSSYINWLCYEVALKTHKRKPSLNSIEIAYKAMKTKSTNLLKCLFLSFGLFLNIFN